MSRDGHVMPYHCDTFTFYCLSLEHCGDLDSLQDLLVDIQPELSPKEYIEADENLATGPIFYVSDPYD